MDSEGVSAVVGTLLIVGMLMLGAVGVLYWGLPAIQGLRDRNSFEHVVNQAGRFNEELRALALKGDAQNAARPVLNIPGGTLQVTGGHRVLVAYMIEAPDYAALDGSERLITNPYNVSFWDWGDDDNDFELVNTGRAVSLLDGHRAVITVEEVEGETFTNVGGYAGDLATNAHVVITLTPPGYSMAGKVLHIRGESQPLLGGDGATFLEAWLMDVGAVEYEIGTSRNTFQLWLENGALMKSHGGDAFFEEPPLIQLPNTQVNHDTFTWRFLQLTGSTGAGGTGTQRYPFFLSLVQNEARLEGPAASIVRMYVNGTTEDDWNEILSSLDDPAENPMIRLGAESDDGLQYAERPNASQYKLFRVKLVHSEILVRVTPGG